MRVPDDFLNMTVFIGGRDSAGQPHYRATAFFVGLPTATQPKAGCTVLVTAKHNVLRALDEYGNVCIRANVTGGGVIDIDIHEPWLYPENEASDAAIVPFDYLFGGPRPRLHVLPAPQDWFATPELVRDHQLGVGDELIVTGLFSRHVGGEHNLPLVRLGSIASMPIEPLIDPNSGLPYDAFLVEVRSIGGLSGSPVFVVMRGSRSISRGITNAPKSYYLLGLIRGHWNRRADSIDFGDPELDELNTGIAIVTPIIDILPMLEYEEIVSYRKDIEKRTAETDAPVEDFAASQPESEYERFEDLTRKLVNVPKKELDEKRKDES